VDRGPFEWGLSGYVHVASETQSKQKFPGTRRPVLAAVFGIIRPMAREIADLPPPKGGGGGLVSERPADKVGTKQGNASQPVGGCGETGRTATH
jgi:hypothetical protein